MQNGSLKIVDDLLGKSHMTGLYVQACTLPYTLTGGNIQDVQNIQDSKPICYVDEHWLESYFFTDEVVEELKSSKLINFHQEIVKNWFVRAKMVSEHN